MIEKYLPGLARTDPFLSINNCCLLIENAKNRMSLDHRFAAIVQYEQEDYDKGQSIIFTDGYTQMNVDMGKLQARDVAYWPTNTEVFLYPKEQLYPQGTLILYNPFTQQSKVISPAFPHLVDGVLYRVPNWDSAPKAPKYDPSLSRVVYFKDNFMNPDTAIILWDLETNTEVWRRNLKSLVAWPWSSEPEWSPDGSRFAVFLPDMVRHETLELTLVDRAGNETILLDQGISKRITWGSGITWSPNGQYISFYVQEERGVRLLVYDFELNAGLGYFPDRVN